VDPGRRRLIAFRHCGKILCTDHSTPWVVRFGVVMYACRAACRGYIRHVKVLYLYVLGVRNSQVSVSRGGRKERCRASLLSWDEETGLRSCKSESQSEETCNGLRRTVSRGKSEPAASVQRSRVVLLPCESTVALDKG
jgi:hypothetical protein